MVWLTVEAVGFLAITVVVIALARGSTSRWEQEKRARRATRRDAVARPVPPGGAAARIRKALGRTVVTAGRIATPVRRPLSAVTGVLGTARTQVVSRVGPSPRVFGALRAAVRGPRRRAARLMRSMDIEVLDPLADDGRAEDVASRGPEPALGTDQGNPGAESGVAGQDPLPAPRLPRRRARGLLHPRRRRNPRVQQPGADQSPTAS
jgi:hypothetical protein